MTVKRFLPLPIFPVLPGPVSVITGGENDDRLSANFRGTYMCKKESESSVHSVCNVMSVTIHGCSINLVPSVSLEQAVDVKE